MPALPEKDEGLSGKHQVLLPERSSSLNGNYKVFQKKRQGIRNYISNCFRDSGYSDI